MILTRLRHSNSATKINRLSVGIMKCSWALLLGRKDIAFTPKSRLIEKATPCHGDSYTRIGRQLLSLHGGEKRPKRHGDLKYFI